MVWLCQKGENVVKLQKVIFRKSQILLTVLNKDNYS